MDNFHQNNLTNPKHITQSSQRRNTSTLHKRILSRSDILSLLIYQFQFRLFVYQNSPESLEKPVVRFVS